MVYLQYYNNNNEMILSIDIQIVIVIVVVVIIVTSVCLYVYYQQQQPYCTNIPLWLTRILYLYIKNYFFFPLRLFYRECVVLFPLVWKVYALHPRTKDGTKMKT